jgi:RNA-splicing ligase RtcB
MQVMNLSAEQEYTLRNWLPPRLDAERVVFFPDACPGKSPLPTGTATLLRRSDFRRFAVSDCGCGMRLLRGRVSMADLTAARWDRVADLLQENKNRLGDLGGGNHFLDALRPSEGEQLHFLIHTGSRNESGLVDEFVDQPERFDQEFSRVVAWARSNRESVQAALEQVFGKLELVLDLPHNTYEVLGDGGVIIRKGAVRIRPGELNVIPSHMSGDVALVRATERVKETLHSLSHGTGRTMPRSESKGIADTFDFDALRRKVLIPDRIANSSLRTDGPFAYRDLDSCLDLLDGFVEVESRFAVAGYIGHL